MAAMKNTAWRLHAIHVAFLFAVVAMPAAQSSGQSSWDLPPGSPGLIQPQELAKALQSSSARITVLYVQAHIRGAEFIGPATNPQALDVLRKRVAALPKNSVIVLYCGCCPWDHCPNIRPAYNVLQTMGFTKVKALYIPHNFGIDWVDKGYLTEKGQ
jgi:thiosulfate/3-mercaptopyruvate sulfurtransferase